MKQAPLTLTANTEQVSQLLAVVSGAKQTSPFTEQFTERFQFLLDTGDLLIEAGSVNFGDSPALTGDLVIVLKPSDAFLCLATAFLAGNGDFSVFDHEYSFSQNIETSVTKFERYDSVVNQSDTRCVHTVIFKDPESFSSSSKDNLMPNGEVERSAAEVAEIDGDPSVTDSS
tara:strand:- start:2917 stop:3432 length:516 start_codon:yes stop_codon:yes gene_type:complete